MKTRTKIKLKRTYKKYLDMQSHVIELSKFTAKWAYIALIFALVLTLVL